MQPSFAVLSTVWLQETKYYSHGNQKMTSFQQPKWYVSTHKDLSMKRLREAGQTVWVKISQQPLFHPVNAHGTVISTLSRSPLALLFLLGGLHCAIMTRINLFCCPQHSCIIIGYHYDTPASVLRSFELAGNWCLLPPNTSSAYAVEHVSVENGTFIGNRAHLAGLTTYR